MNLAQFPELGWSRRVSRSNWTFGLWWGRIGKYQCFGIDIGPLEIIHRGKP